MKTNLLAVALAAVLTSVSLAAEPKTESLDALLQRVIEDADSAYQESKEIESHIAAANEARQKQHEARQKQHEARQRRNEETWYSVSSENFVVGAVGKSSAEAILSAAEKMRVELAAGLPAGHDMVLIRVTLTDGPEDGVTLIAGPGTQYGGNHRVWLETTKARACGEALRTELRKIYQRQPGDANPSRTQSNVPVDVY